MKMNENAKSLYREAMSEFVAKQYDRAIELFSESLSADPEHILAYTSRGAAFLQRDLPENAVADFDRAIELDDQYAKAYHLRGLAKEGLGDTEAAMKDLDRAIELDPEYGAAYYSRANLFTRLGDNDRATEDIETVTHITNRNIEVFANESNIWRSHHLQVEDAIESEIQR